jgi:hypothetical protein
VTGFVEEFGDGSELLGACCVPDLHFDQFFLDLHHVGAKLHANGNLVIVFENVLS